MNLFLHIGTEKTGSSFLQTMAARNRDNLVACGIYFPEGGKRERDMLAGRVSPGNAKSVFDAASKGDWKLVRTILYRIVNEGTDRGCEAVLLSNENLIELAAVENGFKTLQQVALEVGFNNIEALLILRNPVDQALSLYKHRAKSGNVKSIDDWLKSEFHLAHILDRFLCEKNNATINWSIRKYSKSSSKMVSAFFYDWLKIDRQIVYQEELVNPSLTLSELLFLKNQYNVNASLVPYYYEALLKVSLSDKASDQQLEEQYKVLIHNMLSKHRETFLALNLELPSNEQLDLPQNFDQSHGIQTNQALVLSEKQIKTLLDTQHTLYSIWGQLRTTVLLGKIKLIKFLKRW